MVLPLEKKSKALVTSKAHFAYTYVSMAWCLCRQHAKLFHDNEVRCDLYKSSLMSEDKKVRAAAQFLKPVADKEFVCYMFIVFPYKHLYFGNYSIIARLG